MHTLYNGDCFEMIPKLEDGSIELDSNYFEIAKNRIEEANNTLDKLF